MLDNPNQLDIFQAIEAGNTAMAAWSQIHRHRARNQIP